MPVTKPTVLTLIAHLKAAYNDHVEQTVKETGDKGIPSRVGPGARAFADFCETYLAENKAVSVFYPPAGLGVVLSNHVRVTLGRVEAPQTGSMQSGPAVPITKGEGMGEGSVPI